MLAPTMLHAVGVVVLGVAPAWGLALVEGSASLALAGLPGVGGVDLLPPMRELSVALTRIGMISAALVVSVAALWWLRSRLGGSRASQHVTWGCGYTAPNTRMQYTGSSFSWDFSQRFRGVMVLLRRQRAPEGYFPKDAYLISDCVDAVERRLFAVIKHGDESATDLSRRLKEDDPRLAFAAALVALVLIGGLVVLSGGPLR
jgi:hydrogenase-4 component B